MNFNAQSPISDLAAEPFLRELRLLFAGPRAVIDGRIDPGFNCMAVSFAVVHLCRLRGLGVDQCFGDLMLLEKSGPNKHMAVIAPHAWVGSPKHRDVDLSIADYEGIDLLPVIHDRVPGPNLWMVRPAQDEHWFREIVKTCRHLPKDRYLLYLHRKRGIFRFDDLAEGAVATASPVTQQLLGEFSDKGLLAKGILHLHLVAKTVRPTFAGLTQAQAWAALNDWDIPALQELSAMLPEMFD